MTDSIAARLAAVLADRYRLERSLGEGGTTVVRCGDDESKLVA